MSRFDGLACATTFEPAIEEVESVVRQLAAVATDAVLFDNTNTPSIRSSIEDSCRRHGISYLSNGRNDGTAIALNAFVTTALALGHGWLYYLDQDSRIEPSTADRLNENSLALVDDRSVALVGSGVDLTGDPAAQSDGPAAGLHETRYVIASGTLMRVSAVVEVDGFDEGLRLDGVDHELCLRLRKSGFRLLIDERRRISHTIGADARMPLRHPRVRVTRHPLWRRRLMWRNTLIVARRYVRVAPFDIARLLAGRLLDTVLGVITYRDPRYVLAACQGILDGLALRTRRVGLSESAAREFLA